MLYTVQAGDTLAIFADRFGVTVNDIVKANVVCHSDSIFTGQVLLIPTSGLNLPKSGGGPFYLVLPDDSLSCLARQFNTSIQVLASNNKIRTPNLIQAYTELLVIPAIPNLIQLQTSWQQTPGPDCQIFEPQIHGVYYIGSLLWYAFGLEAIAPLLQLINHPCAVVRYYTILSLGRIGRDVNGQVKRALKNRFTDPDSSVATLARLALRRLRLVERGCRRTHFLVIDDLLISDVNDTSLPTTPLSTGAALMVLAWHIPSPTGEESPRGGIQIFDQVQVINTGQIGFLARRGDEEISFI